MMHRKSCWLGFVAFILLLACSLSNRPTLKEIVKFSNGDISLEGLLSIPDSDIKHPLAIFVHGSGMTTRNDYEDFVEPFVKEGIAVFRYDKRGVGASGGMYLDVSTETSEHVFAVLASDAAAAIAHFKNDKRIDVDKIILVGGSQAGWIIPEVHKVTNVWLSICLSGPTVSVGEEIYYSELAENGRYQQDEADQIFQNFRGPKGFDPISRIERMTSPSLWLFGGKDISIPVRRCVELLDSVKTLRKLPIEITLYPDADHGLNNNKKKQREDYVKVAIAWINSHRHSAKK
jgi:hypothetical protein